MQTLRFELRQSAGAGAYQHLALFDAAAPAGSAPLAHWVLPYESRRTISSRATLLMTEAPAGLALPEKLLDEGSGTLPTTVLPVAESLNHLRMTLRGTRLCGHFSLQRLRPGGASWLFGPIQFMPDRHPQPVVAYSPLQGGTFQ